MPSFTSRFQNAWNAFIGRDPTEETNEYIYSPMSSSYRQDRFYLTGNSEQTFLASIFNRIAVDVSTVNIMHIKQDADGRFLEVVKDSGLNHCLRVSANIDQTGRELIKDLVMSLFDEGDVAVVITEASANPKNTDAYEIGSLRVGKIIQWAPLSVKVRLYNEQTGKKEERWFPKSYTAIIHNPFYEIMNAPNSTLKRLIRKMNLLDRLDTDQSSGKLNLIIQLPYIVRGDAKRQQAEKRRKEIEDQLTGSKYGIAYADGTEHITQLNRSIENNLPKEVEALTMRVYNQLGLTDEVFKGTASEEVMLNYYTRTIEPILLAITEEFTRKFISKTALTQGKTIAFYRDPFKLVPITRLSEAFHNLITDQVVSANEARGTMGLKPSDDPRANQLVNPNINPVGSVSPQTESEESSEGNEMDLNVENM